MENKIINNFLRYLVDKGVSPTSLKYYKSDISNFLQWKGNKELTNNLVKEYLNSIRLVTPNSTINRRLSTLRSYSQFINKNFMEDIENVSNKKTKIDTSSTSTSKYKYIQDKIISIFAKNEKFQNVLFKVFFNRPNWYKRYHSYPLSNYIHIAILILFSSISGYAIYDQVFSTANQSLAFPSTLERPNRFLSFQGRLTDDLGNPETVATNMVFKLYSVSSGGTSLWDSGTCSITPDQDGVFSTLLGSSCGSEIASSVFSENADVWLGVTAGTDAEATPRIQIATVAYALNSETLQGFPAGTGASTVPYIDSTGTVVLASSSPKIQSTSGTFAVEGQALTITTPNTTNGIVTINPDGTGTLDLTFEGAAPGGSANGFVNATNANITSGSLYSGTVASNASGYNFINFLSGSSPASVFSVQNDGDLLTSGDITVSGGNINTGNIALTVGDGTTDSLTVSTDGTGNAEVVLPNDSIGPNEILSSGQTDEYCLTYELTGTTLEWQSCGSVGSNSWSDLTAPSTNLSLAMDADTTTFGWTSTGALNSWTMNFNNNSTSSTTQNAMVINNAAVGSFTDTSTESLVLLQQLDTTAAGTTGLSSALKIDSAANAGITDGVVITNSGGNITNGINIVDTGSGTITTGIALSGTFTTGIDAGNTIITNIGNAGTDFTSTGGLNIAENIAVTGILQAGGSTATTYSRLGTATTAHASNISTASDLLLSDMEVDGTLFLDGGTIANSAGTATIVLSGTPTTTANTLSAGNWYIDNTANVGQAALIVNQTKAGDLFTASVSGTTKMSINPTGDITLGYSGTSVPSTTNPLMIYNHGTTNVASVDTTGDAIFVGGDITGAGSERIDISEATANAFTFTRNDAGTVTLTSADNDATAALTLVAGGTANLNIGDSGDTIAMTGADMNLAVIDGSTVNLDGDGSPTADLLQIGNGDTTVTTGVDALNLTFGSSNASSDLIHLVPSFAGGGTNSLTFNVIEIDAFSPTNAAGTDTVNGFKIGNLTDPGATITSTAFNIGTGWDTILGGTTAGTNILSFTNATLTSAGALTLGSTLTMSGSAANIALGSNYLSGDGNDEGIFVDSTGKVAIGNAAPTELFHVGAGTDASGYTSTDLLVTRAGDASLEVRDSTNNMSTVMFTSSDRGVIGTIESGYLQFITANTEAMRINTSGNVAIGTGGDPVSRLDIASADNGVTDGRGTLTVEDTTAVAADVGGGIALRGVYTSGGATAGFGGIKVGKANATSGDLGSYLALYSRVSGGAVTEGLRIDANQRVGIGNTNPGTHRLSVTGTAGLSTGTAWTNTSDYRLKNIESDLNDGSLQKIMALNPVSFRWNDLHHSKFGSTSDKLNYGFIAQEVETVLPHMITTDDEGYKWYNPSGFEALLTAGIQEQQKQINSLADRVGGLELADTGDVIITEEANNNYLVSNQNGIINKIGSYAKLTVGKLKAGLGTFNKVETKTISPIANSDLIIDLQPDNSNSPSKLVINGDNDSEVASIDASGNASFAGQVNSEDLEVENDATISGTLYANNIESTKLSEIEELLREVESNQGLLTAAQGWETNTATESGQFTDLIATNIQSKDLFVTGQAAISSLFVSDNLTVSKVDSIDSPLQIQSLAASPLEIMAGKITVDTNGNTKFLGNVEIAGNLTVNNIVVANTTEVVATESAEINQGVINTNSLAGKAVLPANKESVRINNSKVSDNSLIYITPITSTQNKVLYIKAKGQGYFEIGFSETLENDVEFNWWIIELQDSQAIPNQ